MACCSHDVPRPRFAAADRGGALRHSRSKVGTFGRGLATLVYAGTLCATLALAAMPRLAVAQAEISVADAVRFLEQTSFGANRTEIQRVQQMGFEAYLEDQFNRPASGWVDRGLCLPNPGTDPNCPSTRDFYTMYPVQTEFYNKALFGDDQLRQRVVFALAQIWVISAQLQGNFQAGWMDYYLQVLENGAFGRWRTPGCSSLCPDDLMYNITLSPGMGKYLDMAGNYFVANRAANENFARETLQLFNVGVDELNDESATCAPDCTGKPILNDSGGRIPTYDQDIIVGFSKAFTGWNLVPPVDGLPNWRDSMILRGAHDTTSKQLLDNVVLPAGQTPEQDLSDALDNIFQNHNMPVFICKQLIKKLVTSNPSGPYVSDCAQAFKDNGQGIRGDLRAVIKTIILHDEARRTPADPSAFGKLREPVLAVTNILRNFCSDAGAAPCTDAVLGEAFLPSTLRMDQDMFRSPTVFNFYPPDYDLNAMPPSLYGPEFAILSTSTSLARVNMTNALIYSGIPANADRPAGTKIDPDNFGPYVAADPQDPNGDATTVSLLNQIMLHGSMSTDMQTVILNKLSTISDPVQKVQEAVYLIATSSAYQVQR